MIRVNTALNNNGFKRFYNKITRRISWELYVQQVRLRQNIWQFLSSPLALSDLAKGCLHQRYAPHCLSPESDPILNEPYIKEQISTQVEYVYRLKGDFYIEPDSGYTIMNPFSIIHLALPGSDLSRSKATMMHFSGVPSFRKYILARMGLIPVRREQSVVLMRYVFDRNYYHFYNDVMSRLRLLDEFGIDKSIPLVISTKLSQTNFFQQLYNRGLLAERNWIIQDGFYLMSNEVIFAKPFSRGDRLGIDYFLTCIEAPAANKQANRRIFLTRDLSRGRNIVNMNEILPILSEFHFELIDTDHLSVDQQMKTFSEAGVVIGIHGAGLTNIIFRRNGKLKLLEIFPPNVTDLGFCILSKTYNYDYDMIRGYKAIGGGRHAAFHLDPSLFRTKLISLFEQKV
jgi:hypothetical protein